MHGLHHPRVSCLLRGTKPSDHAGNPRTGYETLGPRRKPSDRVRNHPTPHESLGPAATGSRPQKSLVIGGVLAAG